MRLWYAMVAATLLSGCVASAPQQPRTAEQVSAGVKKDDTKFDSLIRHVGPSVTYSVQRPGLGSDDITWTVRAFTSKTNGATERQLYARVMHSDKRWRFFNSASFVGGDLAKTVRIDSTPSCHRYGCTLTEVVGVDLPDQKWRAATGAGLEVRLNAQSGGHVVIKIPAEYISGFDQATKN